MTENWEIHWKDYYKTLQLDSSAEPEVIRGAFDRLARKYHPDVNKDPRAGERMKALNEAYDVLSDPAKKSRYDIAWRQKSGQGTQNTRQSTRTAVPPRPIADPSQIRFTDVQQGETRRASFIVKNVGGPYTKIWVSNPNSWVKVSSFRSLTASDELPIQVEIEATGANWARVYVEYIVIKLDAEEFRVRIELQTKSEPTRTQTPPEPVRSQTPPSPAAGTRATAPQPRAVHHKKSPIWQALLVIGICIGLYLLLAHFLSSIPPNVTNTPTVTQTPITTTPPNNSGITSATLTSPPPTLTSTPTPTLQATIPTTGLVAYYPFNGNANDESGNGHNGTVYGATLIDDRFGKPNSAYHFDGAQAYIGTDYDGILGKNPRTVSLWAKTAVSNRMMEALAYGGYPGGIGNSFRCGFNFYTDAEGVDIDVSNGDIVYSANTGDNQWHHYVWVLPDNGDPRLADVKVYRDGQLLTAVANDYGASQQVVINTVALNKMQIGHFYDSESRIHYYFSGDIDDVRVYNRALSDSEIQALFDISVGTSTPTPTVVTALPGQAIAALKWIDFGKDLVSTTGANPDGISDGHFLVSLNINGSKTIKSLVLDTTDSAGNPVDGQVWSSTGWFWFLGIYRDGVLLDPHNSVINGLVNLDVFGDDSGYFKPGQYFGITIDFIDNTEVKAITTIAATPSLTPAPTPVPTSILTPIITSISKIVASKDQSIIIQGQGFGTRAPYNGDSKYIKVEDVTTGDWGAGYTGTGEYDAVQLNIIQWNDNEIIISGFTGSYGGSWSLHTGDKIKIQVWNVSSGNGPAIYNTIVGPN